MIKNPNYKLVDTMVKNLPGFAQTVKKKSQSVNSDTGKWVVEKSEINHGAKNVGKKIGIIQSFYMFVKFIIHLIHDITDVDLLDITPSLQTLYSFISLFTSFLSGKFPLL